MSEHHILNLGGGVQSTTLYLLACHGAEDVPIEYAVFADTQDEPQAVYDHLAWLESLDGPPIVRVTIGKLSDDLKNGRNSTGERFASIPAFTLRPDGTEGQTRRQCSREYKVDPINQWIRRELLGLKPRQRKPKNVKVYQYFGFSFDEQGRAENTAKNVPYAKFPLIDRLWRRGDCARWLASQDIPHEVPRSACVYCPYHSNAEWRRVQSVKADWELAVDVDRSLRVDGNIVNRNLDQQLFVHRSCRPLDEVDFGTDQPSLFDGDGCDDGGCFL